MIKYFINYFKWTLKITKGKALNKFLKKYPERNILKIIRVKKKHKYYTKIKSFIEIEKETPKIYFINFSIEGTKNYVKGYLSSSFKIPLEDGKKIIKANIKKNYKPVDFYEAEEEATDSDDKTRLIVFREEEDQQIQNEVIKL